MKQIKILKTNNQNYVFKDYIARNIINDLSGKLTLSGSLDNTISNLNYIKVSRQPQQNNIPIFNGQNWVPSGFSLNGNDIKTQLSSLLDVNISNPSSGNVLIYDGQKWKSSTLHQSEVALEDIETILPNGTMEPNKHYKITLTGDTILNVSSGVTGKFGVAQLFINPGNYTLIPGPNLTICNTLVPNKINYCTINWIDTKVRLYIIDTFD